MNNIAELKNLSPEELSDKLTATKRQLFDLRMQAAAGKLEHTHRLKLVRREVAQLMTLLSGLPEQPKPKKAPKPAVEKEKAGAKKTETKAKKKE